MQALAGAEVQRAKPRANGHRHQATPGHGQPSSPQADAIPGDAQHRPATPRTRLGGECWPDPDGQAVIQLVGSQRRQALSHTGRPMSGPSGRRSRPGAACPNCPTDCHLAERTSNPSWMSRRTSSRRDASSRSSGRLAAVKLGAASRYRRVCSVCAGSRTRFPWKPM